MSRNGSGTYSLPAGNPVVTGTTISSTTHNSTLSDIATALTQSLASDGQTTPTANLPMGNYKHTWVGNATVRTNYASAADVQDSTYHVLGTVSGTDTITATAALSMTAYATGQRFWFVSAGANTTAATLNINSIGAKNIKKKTSAGLSSLVAGDIPSGHVVDVVYDGTQFQVEIVRPYIHGADIASASTVNLDTATGDCVDVTGTTTITAITLADGEERTIRFTGILTLTHGSSLVLPGAASITTAAGDYAIFRGYASSVVRCVSYSKADGTAVVVVPPSKLAGDTVQVVGTVVNSSSTGTTTIPKDDSIPQNTEGDQYLSQAITPTSASNYLLIEATLTLANSASGGTIITALFQDSTAGALAATGQGFDTANKPVTVVLRHYMLAGTTSATTFKIRAGCDQAGTTTLNGASGARLFGGVSSSVITVTEIKV